MPLVLPQIDICRLLENARKFLLESPAKFATKQETKGSWWPPAGKHFHTG